MSYTRVNFKTKKALKEALKAGDEIHLQSEFLGNDTLEGTVYLEGPHFPAPHTWYAIAEVYDGKVIKIK